MTKTIRIIATAALFGDATGLFESATFAASTKPQLAEASVAAKAQNIASGIHGIWQQMAADIATWHMTGGALLGNGSVGVAIGALPVSKISTLAATTSGVSFVAASGLLVGSAYPFFRCMVQLPSLARTSAPQM